jgi:hypothetical protein
MTASIPSARIAISFVAALAFTALSVLASAPAVPLA